MRERTVRTIERTIMDGWMEGEGLELATFAQRETPWEKWGGVFVNVSGSDLQCLVLPLLQLTVKFVNKFLYFLLVFFV